MGSGLRGKMGNIKGPHRYFRKENKGKKILSDGVFSPQKIAAAFFGHFFYKNLNPHTNVQLILKNSTFILFKKQII